MLVVEVFHKDLKKKIELNISVKCKYFSFRFRWFILLSHNKVFIEIRISTLKAQNYKKWYISVQDCPLGKALTGCVKF